MGNQAQNIQPQKHQPQSQIKVDGHHGKNSDWEIATDVEDDNSSFHLPGLTIERLKGGVTASRNLLFTASESLTLTNNFKQDSKKIQEALTFPQKNSKVSSEIVPLIKYCSQIFKAGKPMVKKTVQFERIRIDPFKFITMKSTPIQNDYSFHKVVGEGSFGKVYKASLNATGEYRAIKRIDKKNLDQAQLLSIKNEFQMLKKLDHPCIIRLYDIYDAQSYLYVVTELCEGGSLLQLANSQQISQPLLRAILDQLLGAVRYMHDFNILHRDLKLQNVILVKKYKKGKTPLELKIIDFGTALDMSLEESKHTEIMGTPLYMPPEAFSKDEMNDLAWDVWSIGIMILMMRAKALPYTFSTQYELISKIRHCKFAPGIFRKLSEDLLLLTLSMLEELPHNRVKAADTFNSKWMVNCKQEEGTCRHQKTKTIVNLKAYTVGNNLVSVIESFLVSRKVCQEQRQNLAEIFKLIDTDRSGIIQIDELRRFYLENCQMEEIQEGEVDQILKQVDKNQSGKIDFNEFITAMYNRRKLFQIQHLEEAFEFVDSDNNGWISREQILGLLEGGALTQINSLFEQLDNNNDNKISKKEFIEYLRDGNY